MTLVNLLVVVIILCLVFWSVQYLASAFNLPQQVRAVLLVILVAIAVIWLLSTLTGHLNIRLF